MRSARHYDQLILDLAAKSHSVVHGRDLRRAQVSDAVVRNRVRSGFMAPVVGRSFAVGPQCHDPTFDMRCMAGALAAGDDAVIDGAAGAVLLGIWERRCDFVQVTAPRNSLPTPQPGFRFSRSTGIWLPDEMLQVGPIPVGGVRQIAGSFAACHSPWQLAHVIDRAMHRKLVTLEGLEEYAGARRRAPGNATLRAAIRLARGRSAGTKSTSEDASLGDLIAGGAPIPVVNVRGVMGMARDEPDFVWIDRWRNIEIDGPHHDTPAQAEDDRIRDEDAERRGWNVLRVRTRDFWSCRRYVVAQMTRFVSGQSVETTPGTRVLAVR